MKAFLKRSRQRDLDGGRKEKRTFVSLYDDVPPSTSEQGRLVVVRVRVRLLAALLEVGGALDLPTDECMLV